MLYTLKVVLKHPLVCVTEVREVCLLLYNSYRNGRRTRTKKDRGKKNTNVVKIGHLNSDSHEKPLPKMDNLRQSQPAGPPSSPSQLEGILYSLIIVTHYPASFLKAARVRSPQSDQVKCQLLVSLCALGP